MKLNLKVSGIVIFGVVLSMVLPHIILSTTTKSLDKNEVKTTTQTKATQNTSLAMAEKKDSAVPVSTVTEPVVEEPKVEEPKVEAPKVEEVKTPVAPPVLSYQEMTIEQLISSIENGTFKLEYSSEYNTGVNKLTKSKGALYFENHKETYYSEKQLPGASLNIPGRHVADDGTIRDQDGYICVAANKSYLAKGTVVKTSVGPAKVYDSGCASGTIDIYTSW